jgi:hypothetical protein
MKLTQKISCLLASITLLVPGCALQQPRDLASFSQSNTACYDRSAEPYTAIVDSHLHFRAFSGKSVPFTELVDYFRQTGVLFVNIYGIGQMTLPNAPKSSDGKAAILPSIKNDFVNAANLVEFKPQDVHLTLSMTFPDLASPQNIVDLIHLYDKEYPSLFKWMGEVNLVKQALVPYQHRPATKENIKQWADFMAILKQRNIPINIHADLGNDAEPTKYLELMDYVLSLYPENKIIWAHMGLSRELVKMNPAEHVRIMQMMLDKYPNLMLDISWRILYESLFSKPEAQPFYIAFFNRNSTRILPGTDFVAARKENFDSYEQELDLTSRILQYLDDETFRNIALGENYFRLLGLNYHAPKICK